LPRKYVVRTDEFIVVQSTLLVVRSEGTSYAPSLHALYAPILMYWRSE